MKSKKQELPVKRQIKMTASEFRELKEMVEDRLVEYKKELEFFRRQRILPKSKKAVEALSELIKTFEKRFIPRYEGMIRELTIQ